MLFKKIFIYIFVLSSCYFHDENHVQPTLRNPALVKKNRDQSKCIKTF